MPNLVKSSDFKIEVLPDFGDAPIGLGCFLEEPSTLTTVNLALLLISYPLGGLPLVALVGFTWLNDFKALNNKFNRSESSARESMRVIRNLDEAPADLESTPQEKAKVLAIALYDRLSPGQKNRCNEIKKGEGPLAALSWMVGTLNPSELPECPGAVAWVRSQSTSAPEPSIAQPPLAKLSVVQPAQAAIRQARPEPEGVFDRESLLEALKLECPAFIDLLLAPPIRVVGKQRTGKTTFAKLLVLCRDIILQNHEAIACTPHLESGNSYPSEAFKISGIKSGQRDEAAIAREWASMSLRIKRCQTGSYTSVIYDEFGCYGEFIDEETLISVLTSTLREATKFGEHPIYLAHGETSIFLPGSKGLVEPFLRGTVRVETIGTRKDGPDGLPTTQPSGRFSIAWPDGAQQKGQLPDWLTEELLLGLLPQRTAAVETVSVPTRATPSIAVESLPRGAVEDAWEDAKSVATAPSPSAILEKLAIAAGVSVEEMSTLLKSLNNV